MTGLGLRSCWRSVFNNRNEKTASGHLESVSHHGIAYSKQIFLEHCYDQLMSQRFVCDEVVQNLKPQRQDKERISS